MQAIHPMQGRAHVGRSEAASDVIARRIQRLLHSNPVTPVRDGRAGNTRAHRQPEGRRRYVPGSALG